jgi:hypothetical protein
MILKTYSVKILRSGQTRKVPSATEPDVRVHIGRRIVQIERKGASLRPIVPIATTDKAPQLIATRPLPQNARNNKKSYGYLVGATLLGVELTAVSHQPGECSSGWIFYCSSYSPSPQFNDLAIQS